MKPSIAILAFACLVIPASPQQKPPARVPPIPALERWARENLDDSLLGGLAQLDRDQVAQLLGQFERRLAATDVYDLAPLKDTATRLLPLLRRFEDAKPYAIWLETHLDYFEAADDLKRQAKAPPPKGGPPAPAPSPTPRAQRTVWNKKLDTRPLPPLAQTHVPRLKQIFSSERLPPELVWVAEVESSFDPTARSPAGAVGLFQLMPGTARALQLSVSPRDERLEPDKNARAAAQYLRSLQRRFGDWRLALAAYNSGETRVANLLKGQKTKTFDAIAGKLPAETQMYVPKIEATLRKREGLGFADLRMPRG